MTALYTFTTMTREGVAGDTFQAETWDHATDLAEARGYEVLDWVGDDTLVIADDSPSRYEACFRYARAYEDTAWETVGASAWGRLECIASEYHRGEYGWDHARKVLDETMRDAGVQVPATVV